jgi:AraC family L-rhamnose operon regulatory protein RhaS
VGAVVREIEETFYDQWDLDKAAGRTGLSRRRFTDLFRDVSGKTFAEFLTGIRLSHAARLLEGGEHSVTGVIFSCGFNDVSHFYRLFRQRYGSPPGKWTHAGRRSASRPRGSR